MKTRPRAKLLPITSSLVALLVAMGCSASAEEAKPHQRTCQELGRWRDPEKYPKTLGTPN